MMMAVLAAALVAVGPCDEFLPVTSPIDSGATPWHGVYALNRSESDDLDEVAEQATSQMRRRVRKRANSALRERLESSACLRLATEGDTITIESERGVRWKVNRNGTAESGAPRAQGRTMPATVSDREITISGQGEKGEARYQLRRTEDGKRLTVEVYLQAERLEQPVNYELVYDAVPASAAAQEQ